MMGHVFFQQVQNSFPRLHENRFCGHLIQGEWLVDWSAPTKSVVEFVSWSYRCILYSKQSLSLWFICRYMKSCVRIAFYLVKTVYKLVSRLSTYIRSSLYLYFRQNVEVHHDIFPGKQVHLSQQVLLFLRSEKPRTSKTYLLLLPSTQTSWHCTENWKFYSRTTCFKSCSVSPFLSFSGLLFNITE